MGVAAMSHKNIIHETGIVSYFHTLSLVINPRHMQGYCSRSVYMCACVSGTMLAAHTLFLH